MEKQKYEVVCGKNIVDLMNIVNERLVDGWELAGGVSATVRIRPNHEVVYDYYQAMLKRIN